MADNLVTIAHPKNDVEAMQESVAIDRQVLSGKPALVQEAANVLNNMTHGERQSVLYQMTSMDRQITAVREFENNPDPTCQAVPRVSFTYDEHHNVEAIDFGGRCGADLGKKAHLDLKPVSPPKGPSDEAYIKDLTQRDAINPTTWHWSTFKGFCEKPFVANDGRTYTLDPVTAAIATVGTAIFAPVEAVDGAALYALGKLTGNSWQKYKGQDRFIDGALGVVHDVPEGLYCTDKLTIKDIRGK